MAKVEVSQPARALLAALGAGRRLVPEGDRLVMPLPFVKRWTYIDRLLLDEIEDARLIWLPPGDGVLLTTAGQRVAAKYLKERDVGREFSRRVWKAVSK